VKIVLVVGIICLFVGTSVLPSISGDIEKNRPSIKGKNNLVNNKTISSMKNISDYFWTPVIDNNTNCQLGNGFNNRFNSNIRGATKFIENNKEYLLFGTGNIDSSMISYKSISSPQIKRMFKLLSFGVLSIENILFNNNNILREVIRTIDNNFKNITGKGCELWYYNGLKWKQSVGSDRNARIESGFNNTNNIELSTLISYQPSENKIPYLYAGTWNPKEGCELWRTSSINSGLWEPIVYNKGIGKNSSGFGNPNNTAIYSAAVFDGWLYFGTMNWWNGCEIWRTNGTILEKVIGYDDSISNLSNGFGVDEKGFAQNIYAWEMKVYNDSRGDQLYVGTFNIAGCELWRTKNAVNWDCIVGKNGLLDRGLKNKIFSNSFSPHNYGIRRMEVFNNMLYIGTASTPPIEIEYFEKYMSKILINRSKKVDLFIGKGCEIWRYNGSNLTKIIGGDGEKSTSSGFGDKSNAYIWSLCEYDGYLFAGTMNPGLYLLNITTKYSHNSKPNSTYTLQTMKSESTDDSAGCEIWYTGNGDNWYQIVGDEIYKNNSKWPRNGFGNEKNIGARSLIEYNNSLYVGVMNGIDGCEVWKFDGNNYPSKPNNSINQINITFESSDYTLYGEIYYPSVEGVKYPCIVFCEGYASYVNAYNWIAKSLAEKGYVVMIFDPPGLGYSEGLFHNHAISIPILNIYFRPSALIETPIQYLADRWDIAVSDAITYLTEKSPVHYLVDNTSIGLIGHSLGGITVTETAVADKRVDAVVALSQGNPRIVNKINVPIQFQCGCFDFSTYSIPIQLLCYRKANTPKELIMIQLGTHYGFTTIYRKLCPCPPWQKEIIVRYATAWFDYFLKSKSNAYGLITTGTDYPSKIIKSRYNFGDGEHILK
jgi:dienelactone hydrolase